MPYDSSGVWSLTNGYLAVTGQVVSPTNHNPPLEDISTNGLSAVLVRDGRAPMTGPLNMGTTNKIINLAAGTVGTDGVNKSQMDTAIAAGSGFGAQVQGMLYGLTLSNNTGDPTNDIDVSTGSAAAGSAPFNVMTLTSSLGKRLDAAWTVGGTPASSVGGLDTGSIANATYHVYLIQRSDTGVVDACFSLSASAPTIGGAIPAAYDRYRRIGSIVRVAAAIKAFKQDGDRFMWATTVNDATVTAPGSTAVTRTLTLPTGISVTAILSLQYFNNVASTATSYFLISDLGTPDATPNTAAFSLSISLTGVTASGQVFVQTNTSAQVRSRTDTIAATISFLIATNGWVDTRGRV